MSFGNVGPNVMVFGCLVERVIVAKVPYRPYYTRLGASRPCRTMDDEVKG